MNENAIIDFNWNNSNETDNQNQNIEEKNSTFLNKLIISPLKNTLNSITRTSITFSQSISFLNGSNNSNNYNNIYNNSINITNFNNNNLNILTEIHNFNNYNEIINTIESVNDAFRFYYIPLLVFTGSIGNILSVFVFFKTKLRKLSSSYYLAALAVTDTLFLVFVFIQWLNNFDINLYNREGLCQLFTFCTTMCSFLSVWFVVAFTVERFIAVMYPLKRQTMCTVRRAKVVLIGLTLIATVHSLPYLFLASPIWEPSTNSNICDFKIEYKEYMTILNYVDTVVVFVVPFTTIVILNIFTGCTVWKFANVRRTMTTHKRKPTASAKAQLRASSSTSLTTQNETGSKASGKAGKGGKRGRKASRASTSGTATTKFTNCPHPNGRNSIKSRGSKSGRKKFTNSSQIKVTKMLVIVSTVFVCLNLPSYVMRVRSFVVPSSKAELNLQYFFWFLFLTNFGINFVLYCVSGQNFRLAVVSMFRKAASTSNQREGITQATVSEYLKGSNSAGASRRRTLTHNESWTDVHELKEIGSNKLK